MKYLVMECHPGYAVVLDEQGRFLRAANLNYQVGQTLESVEPLQEVEHTGSRKRLFRILAAAACLCLVLLGGARLTLAPYGVVHMQINPEVEITVNRFDYVLQVTGVNPEGDALVAGYSPTMKKVDQVADELTDRAMKLGYLSAGGQLHLAVESSQAGWQSQTQSRLIRQLTEHTQGSIQVIGEDMDHWRDWEDPEPTPPPQPILTEEPELTSHHGHDRDDCGHDDERDEDDDDDEEDDEYDEDDEGDGDDEDDGREDLKDPGK